MMYGFSHLLKKGNKSETSSCNRTDFLSYMAKKETEVTWRKLITSISYHKKIRNISILVLW